MTIEYPFAKSTIMYFALRLISLISILVISFARFLLKGIRSLLFLTNIFYGLIAYVGLNSSFVVSTSGSSGTYLNCLLSSTTSPGTKLPIACLY